MKNQTIKPLSDLVVAVKEQPEHTTTEGLYLPENSKEKPLIAVVESVGPNVESIKVGDRIIYKQYETDTEINNIKYLIIKEQDILAIL